MLNRPTAGARIVALTVGVALVGSSLASAQTPESRVHTDAGAQPTVMSAAAFARLAQPREAEAPSAVAAEAPRLDLTRQARVAAMAHPPTSLMKPPRQQKNWFMRNPALAWLIIGGGIFLGAYLAACGFRTTCDD